MPQPSGLPIFAGGGSLLAAFQTPSLFEDTPASRRRLVLTLYAAVTPGFVGSLLFLGRPLSDPRPLAVIVALILLGALWVYLRRTPSTGDWLFPVAVGPTACVGIAYASSGATGDAYLALVGAPLVCAAALFERPVVLTALGAVIATVVLSLRAQTSAGATAVGTLLLAPAAAIASWVIYSSANQFRVARRELQRLGQRDRALLRSLPDVLVRVDRAGRILDVHVPPREGGPVTREDLAGRAIHDLVPRGEAGAMRDAVARAFASDEPQRLEYAAPGPGGDRSYEARLVRSGSDEVTVIRRDTTDQRRADDERRRAEEALRESERWLRMSQEIARIGHYVYDVASDRWESSATLDRIFGIDASFPRKAADWVWLVHPEDRDAMREYLGELLTSGNRFDREYRIVNQATGASCWVHGLGELTRSPEGAPVRLVGTIQDVSARKAAEVERNALQSKLALSARLAAMGTLVAGVAHEINNPLAAEIASQGLALDAAREARTRLDAGPGLDVEQEARLLGSVIESLEDAQEAGQRIARLVKDFAAFGRPNPPRTRARLADVVKQALTWVPGWVSQAAAVRVEHEAAPDVLVASSQIEQVVINLVSNAAKAIPTGKRGTIVLRVGPAAGAVRLEVTDDGVGIPPEHLERIFEPFFTTRPAGDQRGIGIGLAISHSIVEAHGGSLTVQSEPGKGSTFLLTLPPAPVDG